jgi:hypothetical protein
MAQHYQNAATDGAGTTAVSLRLLLSMLLIVVILSEVCAFLRQT